MIGSPSELDYKAMVSSNVISNRPISQHDVSNAHTMFGLDLAGVYGKTTRSKPERVVEEYVATPRDFVLRNKTITLLLDVSFVDGIAFLLTLRCRIKFVAVKHTPSRTAENLVIHLKHILRVYHRVGFTMQCVLMDSEFEKIKN